MPFSVMTDEQILALLSEQPKITRIPGVALVCVEFIDVRRSQVAVVVTAYAGEQLELSRLPVTVAGLPVIVKVEVRRTRRVVEIIDPRKNGGSWPHTNRLDSAGI